MKRLDAQGSESTSPHKGYYMQHTDDHTHSTEHMLGFMPKDSNIRTNDNVADTVEEVTTEVDIHHCRSRHGGGLEPAWVKKKEWEMRRHGIVSVLSLLPKERRGGGGGGIHCWPFSHGTLPLALLEIGLYVQSS